MLSKIIDLNCGTSEYFEIEFEENNSYGITADQEMLDRWLSDLRSGKYKQLQESLFQPDSDLSYCALGVLCKKRIRRFKQKSATENSNLDQLTIINDIIEHVTDYFANVIIYSYDGFRYDILNFLIELNDYCNLSFNMIADIMEAIHKEIRGEDNSKLLKTLSRNDKWELLAI